MHDAIRRRRLAVLSTSSPIVDALVSLAFEIDLALGRELAAPAALRANCAKLWRMRRWVSRRLREMAS